MSTRIETSEREPLHHHLGTHARIYRTTLGFVVNIAQRYMHVQHRITFGVVQWVLVDDNDGDQLPLSYDSALDACAIALDICRDRQLPLI